MRDRPIAMCGHHAFTAIAVDEHDLFTDPGVYMFGRSEPTGIVPLYAGEGQNIAERLGPGHEHWSEAIRRGMNVILVHLLAQTLDERRTVEEFLIRTYDPPINKLKPAPDALDALHDIFASRFLPATPPPAPSSFGFGALFDNAVASALANPAPAPTRQNALLGLFAEAVASQPPANALIRALLEPPPPPNPFLSLFVEAAAHPPAPSTNALVRALLEPPLSRVSNALGSPLRRP